MLTQRKWLHGTEVRFAKWKVDLPPQPHKNYMPSHSAIFFTSYPKYARDCATKNGVVYTAELHENARILDMNQCDDSESEAFRLAALQRRVTCDTAQVHTVEAWQNGWKTGQIMKYSPSTPRDSQLLFHKLYLAQNFEGTLEGDSARNELQVLTRNNIEGLVDAARSLGYDGVIGNEIDSIYHSPPKTFEVLFVTNPLVLTPPVIAPMTPAEQSSVEQKKASRANALKAEKNRKKMANKSRAKNRGK